MVVDEYGFRFTVVARAPAVAVAPSPGSPERCWASEARVTAPAGVPASSGRARRSGSSGRTSPRVTASANNAAVNVLVTEPISKGAPASAGPSPAVVTEVGVTSATASDR